LGIIATLAANVAHGLGHGLIGAAVGAWPAVALVGSHERVQLVSGSLHSGRRCLTKGALLLTAEHELGQPLATGVSELLH
jgi:hypothetical protein